MKKKLTKKILVLRKQMLKALKTKLEVITSSRDENGVSDSLQYPLNLPLSKHDEEILVLFQIYDFHL